MQNRTTVRRAVLRFSSADHPVRRRINRIIAHDNRRPDRVAEAIREEVATFLAEGVKDPRVVGLVTVTGVDVTRDLRNAKVFVSILGSESERAATLDGLASV